MEGMNKAVCGKKFHHIFSRIKRLESGRESLNNLALPLPKMLSSLLRQTTDLLKQPAGAM